MKIKKYKGFTLLELMVSIVLMLILVGAAIDVFHNTSEVFNKAQAKMFIYANARALFKNLENDISAMDKTTLVINAPDSNPFVSFNTYTSWKEGNDTKKGEVKIEISLEKYKGNLFRLHYKKVDKDDSTHILAEYTIAEYIPVYNGNYGNSIKVERIVLNTTSDGTPPYWKFTSSNSSPDGLRITLILTDKYQRERRVFTKIFFIAKN